MTDIESAQFHFFGADYAGHKVLITLSGVTASLFTDATGNTPAPNPVTVGPNGQVSIFAAVGTYVATDTNGSGAAVTVNVVAASVIPAANLPIEVVSLPMFTAGPPQIGDGENGDYAFDKLTQNWWGPKAAGAWPAAPFQTPPGASLRPTGALVESFPSGTPALVGTTTTTTGTARIVAVEAIAGQVYSAVTFEAQGTVLAGATHQWGALLDASSNVVAVSADGTSSAWGNGGKTFVFSNSFTPSVTGLYYLVVSVTASTMPSLVVVNLGFTYLAGLTPIKAGLITGTSTPPALGANLGAITPSSAFIYGYLS